MTPPRKPAPPAGPGVLDGLALLATMSDEVVLGTVRDTHRAVTKRLVGRGPRPLGGLPTRAQGLVGDAVYAGIGAGLRGTARGLGAASGRLGEPRLEAHPAGRVVRSAVNGLIGDRLETDGDPLALGAAVRVAGADVDPRDPAALAAAYPDATDAVAVLLHGLGEDESVWGLHREAVGATYPETLAELGVTPVLLRMNTGLGLRVNGVTLAALLRDLVASWPVPPRRLVLVGHSMGGLVIRAATAVADATGDPAGPTRAWTDLVTDVVTLGTPHLGAPLAGHVGLGSRALARLEETAAFGRLLDHRSTGIRDLVAGLDEDVAALPRARYHLVAGVLPTLRGGPLLGDLLVRPPSAHGRGPGGRDLFPGADRLLLRGADHFALANHADVHAALRRWLASPL